MAESQKQIVVLIHGIRTQGEWHELVAPLLTRPGRQVLPIKYGFLNVLSFLIPFWTRARPISKVLWRLNSAVAQNPDAELIVIAHSFGTYALARILRENPNIRPVRAILCGGIVSRDFRWDQLPNRPHVVNECGARDIWPILATSVTWGFGASGTFGFGTPGVTDRYHNFSHGDYFTKEFATEYWLPFVEDGTVTPSAFQETRPPAPWWRSVLGILPLRWAFLGALVVSLVLALLPLLPNGPGCAPVDSWVEVAKAKREAGVISSDRSIPSDVVSARASFENWWKETPQSVKQKCANEQIFNALSLNCRIYRVQEIEGSRKASSLEWINEAIGYFEEVGDTHFLVEALLDKGAVYLELSDIEHADPDDFKRVSEDGDAVLRRANDLAEGPQKSDALRIWSRFYYNLARPKEGQLDQDWDNNYLLTSHQKTVEAIALDPKNSKNISTYARATQRASRNPPQDKSPEWAGKLRDAQIRLLEYWNAEKDTLSGWRERVSPLNILGVITFEVCLREWLELSDAEKTAKADSYLNEIEDVALPAEREAFTLIRGTELEEDYDYDFAYDIARMHAARLAILDHVGSSGADQELKLVISNLLLAKKNGTTQQWQAGARSFETAPAFTALSSQRIEAIREATRN